jgi:hypothetical protein
MTGLRRAPLPWTQQDKQKLLEMAKVGRANCHAHERRNDDAPLSDALEPKPSVSMNPSGSSRNNQ